MILEKLIKDKKQPKYYIGLMSGTSADGIDVSVIETDGKFAYKSIVDLSVPFEREFKSKILSLNNSWKDFLELEVLFSKCNIQAVKKILSNNNIDKNNVIACGFHGQTIFHDPSKKISWQLGNPHLMANDLGIDIVYDFRRRDVANGGQGAPLIPIFLKCLVRKQKEPCFFLNIGGVSNITCIIDNKLVAFDLGPGNAMIDDLARKHFNLDCDKDGEIAKSGKISEDLVDEVLKDKYFTLPYPKSLDRNYFNKYLVLFDHLKPADSIASLTYLTVKIVVSNVKTFTDKEAKLWVYGGGVHK